MTTEIKPLIPGMASLEHYTGAYASSRAALANALEEMQDALDNCKRSHMGRVKKLAQKSAESEALLREFITANPNLFIKPRTFTLHGIKVGFTAASGKIVFDDADTVVKLIRRHFKDKTDLLIRSKEEPNKDGLATLPESDLPKLGCRITGRGDKVVCKSVDDEIEKMISKLINDMVETVLEQQEAA